MTGKRVRRRARSRVVPLVAVSLAAGVGLAWGLGNLGEGSGASPAASREKTSAPTSPPGSASASPSVTPSPVQPARRNGHRPEAPSRVRLPSGTTVPVVAVGTRKDGVLDVPEDIRTAGWWRGGSRLGDPFGSTLVAAHIDSKTQGLGPYAELLTVRAGARIEVRSAHLRQVFRVTSLRLLPRGDLSDHGEIFAASGQRRLTMVTCAAPYDPDRGGYQNLAVVTASPIAAAAARSTR